MLIIHQRENNVTPNTFKDLSSIVPVTGKPFWSRKCKSQNPRLAEVERNLWRAPGPSRATCT